LGFDLKNPLVYAVLDLRNSFTFTQVSGLLEVLEVCCSTVRVLGLGGSSVCLRGEEDYSGSNNK
jgi:hypothetical protein